MLAAEGKIRFHPTPPRRGQGVTNLDLARPMVPWCLWEGVGKTLQRVDF